MKKTKRDIGKISKQIIYKRIITLILTFGLIFGMIPMMGLAESESLYDDNMIEDESSPDEIIEEINEDDPLRELEDEQEGLEISDTTEYPTNNESSEYITTSGTTYNVSNSTQFDNAIANLNNGDIINITASFKFTTVNWYASATISGKSVEIRLNGYALDGDLICASGAVVTITGDNTSSEWWGLRIIARGNSTNVIVNGNNHRLSAWNGARMTANGRVFNVEARSGANVVVNGNVDTENLTGSAVSSDGGNITINGNINVEFGYSDGIDAVHAFNNGTVRVNGNINLSGPIDEHVLAMRLGIWGGQAGGNISPGTRNSIIINGIVSTTGLFLVFNRGNEYRAQIAEQYNDIVTINGVNFRQYFSTLGIGSVYVKTTEVSGKYFLQTLPAKKSDIYHPELARICAELSAAAYSSFDIISELEGHGFSRVDRKDYYADPSDSRYGSHNVAHTFAERWVGNKRIVAIVIRGTYGGITSSDWLSNLDILREPETKNHMGFNTAKWRVGYGLEAYLGGIPTDGNTIYLITGHSRGGAVANLLAVHLSRIGVPKEAVFNYNFGNPDNAVGPSNGSKWNPGNKHSNIFNICNNKDAVPYVPRLNNGNTPDGDWGKYGITLWHSFECRANSCPNGINHLINHDVNYYVNFVKRNSSGGSLTNNNRILPAAVSVLISMIKCPVDVQVYDRNNMLVAEIVDNELVYYDSSLDRLMVLIDGDIKTIITMDGEEYNFKITGTDTGTLDYSVSNVDVVSQSISVFKEFNNIPLADGKKMTSAVDGDIDTPDVRLFVVDTLGNVLDEIEGQVMIPQPFGVSLDKAYVAMQIGQTTQLDTQVTKPSPGAVGINWKSSSTSVATVDSNGVITAIGVGTTTITAFNEELGIATECRIDVTHEPVGSSVESVRLLQTSVTSNALSTNYTRIPLQLVLPQNRQDANTLQMFNASGSIIEQSITSVTLLDDPNGFFTTNVIDDRFVELIPTQALISSRTTSLRTRLLVDIDGTEFTTGFLTIRINRTLPRLRATAVRFNSFFPDAPVNVVMTTSVGGITNVELLPEQDYEQVVFNSENRTLSLKSDRSKSPARLAFNVTVDGFADPIKVLVSTSVRLTNPTARLNVSTVTMRKSAELKITGQNISSVEVLNNVNYVASEVDTEGIFTLAYTGGDAVLANTRLTLKINFIGSEQSVTRNITVRPPPARLGIRLSQTSVTLNRRVDEDNATILVTTNPGDAIMSEIAITGDTERFDINIIGKNVGIGLNSDTPTGTYRILFGTVRLTVRVVDANPSIRLTARGSFNVIDPNSTITLTPRFTNYNYTGSTPIIDNDNFEIVSVSPSGVVTLRMSDNDVKPRTRQSVTLTYDDWISAPINITPRQVKPRLLPIARQVTLQANDVHSTAQLDIAVQTPSSARISRVEIHGNNANLYSIREIQNGSYSIGFKDQTIRRGTNIRLNVFFAGSDLPVAVTVRVVVN